jgi:TolB-like protein
MTFTAFNINAQTLKVAILDFENISGILKYDGLGKAMSSMLITDIEANVSPKRLQLVERAQIQKILKEQNFQKTSSVDKATTVKAGKILGVKYLLVGDIYILNDALIINARLIDAESGDIKFSKKQEGKVAAWLMLKTIIAKELAASISMPFTEPNIPDKEMNVATITTFGNAVAAKDDGKLEKAEELLNTVQEFSPDFKYLDDLKSQLDELKKQVQKNTEDIKRVDKEVVDNVTDYLETGYKYESENNFENAKKYFLIGYNKVDKSNIVNYLEYLFALSQLSFNSGDYNESLRYSEIGLNVYPYFKEFLYFKYLSFAKLNKLNDYNQIVKIFNDFNQIKGDSLIIASLKIYSEKNNINYKDIEEYLQWKKVDQNLISAIRYDGEFYFNPNYNNVQFVSMVSGFIDEMYRNNPKQAVLLLKKIDNSSSLLEIKKSIAWYTMISGEFASAQNKFDEIVLNSFSRISDCINPIEKYINNGSSKFPLNELIGCLKSSNCLSWNSISESKKMDVINWAHSYLLNGNIIAASKIYKLFPADFQFSKDYGYKKIQDIIENDWSDFQKMGIISNSKISEIRLLTFEK